ncbi:MAG: ABC transporter substrate-binding protein [Anaerolineales bacterium]
MSKLRIFLMIALLVALVAGAFGTVTAQDDEEVTLRLMNWSGEQADFYEEVAAAFNEEYPNITLEVEILGQAEYREAMPLLFQQNEAPDIFFWISQSNRVLTAAELRDLGWLSPIQGADEDWQARWPEGSFVEGVNVFDGEVFSFPFNDNKIWGPGYMFYNEALFEAAGIESPPATWSELRDTCAQIVENTGTFCMAVPLQGNQFQRTWYPLAGVSMTDQFFDYQTGTFAIDDPRLIDTFNFVQELYNEDYFVPGVEDQTFMRQAFGNGLAAIYFDGAWIPSVLPNMGFEDMALGVAAPPVPDGGATGALAQTLSENKYFISSQTEHPEEAALFIEWMTRPDGFFAQNYLDNSFGTLAYTDNAQYIGNEVFAELAEEIGGEFRVLYPEPVIACPDVAQSEAFRNANQIRPNWEFEEMVEALVGGDDFAPVAAEIAAEKDSVFQETIEAEAEAGLNISMDCFTFPDFEYQGDYMTEPLE